MADTRELTLTDKKKLEEELEQLIEAKKQVAEEIKIARGFGDLSENAEYDAAKKEEARVYGRLNELEELLRTATFVDDTKVSTEAVAVGTVVTVLDTEFDEQEEYTIVGFTEADPMKLFISQDSPIGGALIGAHVGDVVDINEQTSQVTVNGQVLEEPYLNNATLPNGDVVFPVTVPKGCVFVMGDNRMHSTDSRSSDIGFIDERDILGKVLYRFFPLDRIGRVG